MNEQKKLVNGEIKIIGGLAAITTKIVVASGLLTMSGCGFVQGRSELAGVFTPTQDIQGFDTICLKTADGIRAEGDVYNGLIRTGKETAKQKSRYFQHRAAEEVQITEQIKIRETNRPHGIFSDLFSKKGK